MSEPVKRREEEAEFALRLLFQTAGQERQVIGSVLAYVPGRRMRLQGDVQSGRSWFSIYQQHYLDLVGDGLPPADQFFPGLDVLKSAATWL